ncbi:MAG: hypothetical protein NT027_15275 [Proteobacteria bacterium]|nr:hypothetical protein [Pseudomonadota bacterium]
MKILMPNLMLSHLRYALVKCTKMSKVDKIQIEMSAQKGRDSKPNPTFYSSIETLTLEKSDQ